MRYITRVRALSRRLAELSARVLKRMTRTARELDGVVMIKERTRKYLESVLAESGTTFENDPDG
jgi:hypothetical protein